MNKVIDPQSLGRRRFMKSVAAIAAVAACGQSSKDPLFRISLAQWSLHRRIFGSTWRETRKALGKEGYLKKLRTAPDEVLNGTLDPLDFPVVTRQEFGIDAVEYVNQFYLGKARDTAYLGELKNRADGEGVKSLLIMCDKEGDLGDPDPTARAQAIENHHQWVDAAAFLGCHSIRVNARSQGAWAEQMKLAADGLNRLATYADSVGINVIVENHGGLSSNGEWLVSVLRAGDHKRLGTLPDFGNFKISADEAYDNYQGIEELMPLALGVSAKSHGFGVDGSESNLDYRRLMKAVVDAGYRGYVGIEYEGADLSEHDGIMATKSLLERVRAELSET